MVHVPSGMWLWVPTGTTPSSMFLHPYSWRCEWLLLQVSFSGDLSGFTPDTCVLTSWGAWPLPCTALSPPPESTASDTVENSVCPKHPSRLDVRPWNVKASTGYGYGVVLALVPISGNMAPSTMAQKHCCLRAGGAHLCCCRAGSIVHDGTSRGERYCSARGEILRPLQDQLQRRRSASASSSIKNVSVGSEDDQTPS